ncbi:hypothetical protein [Arthrobacter sp. StoSoilB5]|uniref:hypothetical protein n=1 Tax=Arthrobacter sp. StoSoilB5 TaxID=2830992 RepID=UPI001CC69A31|nr:hypothetical protein [Arthrobacter sp. StoSoilB5]BCW44693.1 hypothetical protein StoSoilB5_18770 [Arthrobacter sp. StoSoilB5]
MALHLHQHWQSLVGRHVLIVRNGAVVRSGTVDDVTVDDEALWLARDGAEPRRLIEKIDGYEVWMEHG